MRGQTLGANSGYYPVILSAAKQPCFKACPLRFAQPPPRAAASTRSTVASSRLRDRAGPENYGTAAFPRRWPAARSID